MFSGNSLLRLVYWTTKSARTTTPKIIRNDLPHPQLRQKVHRRSYKYDLSGDHIANKHLYWNHQEESIKHNQKLLINRAKKFNIRPLVAQQKHYQRSFEEILKQLHNRRLIQKDPYRITSNLFQVLKVYPQESQENNDALLWALVQLEKQVALANWNGFCTFCKLANKLKYQPTQNMFVTLYQHLYSADALKEPIPIDSFSKISNYIFSVEAPQKIKNILHKNTKPLQLFKYNDPRPFSFEELMERLYTREYLQEYVSQNGKENIPHILNGLTHIPGNTKSILSSL